MNSVFTVLCCCCFPCVVGSTVPESTTVLLDTELNFLQGDEVITDGHKNKTYLKLGSEVILNTTNDKDKTKTSLKNSNNKINESELYENGQTEKENNERSFILINQKFKSLWFDGKRPIVPKSKFKSAEEFKHFDKLLTGSSTGFELVKSNSQPSHADQSYTYKSKAAYFRPIHAMPAQIPKGKEYIELLKKPLVRPVSIANRNRSGNDKTHTHKVVTEFFRSQDDDISKDQYYNDDDDSVVPKLAIQNQHHTHNKCNHRDPNILLFERFPITNNYYDNKNTVNDFEDDDKLNHYIRNALKQDALENEINNSLYTCYNASCKSIANKRNQRTFNGIRQGFRCICNYGNAGDRAERQDERPVKEELSTEITDFEAVVKETESLNQLGEGTANAFH